MNVWRGTYRCMSEDLKCRGEDQNSMLHDNHLSKPRGSNRSATQRVKILKELWPADTIDSNILPDTREYQREINIRGGRGGGGGGRVCCWRSVGRTVSEESYNRFPYVPHLLFWLSLLCLAYVFHIDGLYECRIVNISSDWVFKLAYHQLDDRYKTTGVRVVLGGEPLQGTCIIVCAPLALLMWGWGRGMPTASQTEVWWHLECILCPVECIDNKDIGMSIIVPRTCTCWMMSLTLSKSLKYGYRSSLLRPTSTFSLARISCTLFSSASLSRSFSLYNVWCMYTYAGLMAHMCSVRCTRMQD